MGIEGELIAIGPSLAAADRAQVTAVDDASGLLTLDRDLDREAGDFVWLIRGSAGGLRLSGAAPALGAHDSDEIFADGFESGDTSGWSSTNVERILTALPIPHGACF